MANSETIKFPLDVNVIFELARHGPSRLVMSLTDKKLGGNAFISVVVMAEPHWGRGTITRGHQPFPAAYLTV